MESLESWSLAGNVSSMTPAIETGMSSNKKEPNLFLGWVFPLSLLSLSLSLCSHTRMSLLCLNLFIQTNVIRQLLQLQFYYNYATNYYTLPYLSHFMVFIFIFYFFLFCFFSYVSKIEFTTKSRQRGK